MVNDVPIFGLEIFLNGVKVAEGSFTTMDAQESPSPSENPPGDLKKSAESWRWFGDEFWGHEGWYKISH